MDKNKLLSYIDDVFRCERGYYNYTNIPSTIGYAIYCYGSNDIRDIVCFIDLSDNLDGSKGIIFTTDALYFDLNVKASFKYDDITSLKLSKDRNDFKGYINDVLIDYEYVQENMFIKLISNITDVDITLDMNDIEKIAYLVPAVLDDIKDDLYEDVELTNEQYKKLKDLYDDVDTIHRYTDNTYYLELETLCRQALEFFNELEIDSEEIDELEAIYAKRTQQQDEAFDQAKAYYDKMMNDYQKGDTKMFDQIKSAMNMLGIKEEDLAGKTPDEIEDYLCHKLGVSKEQLAAMKKKMGL